MSSIGGVGAVGLVAHAMTKDEFIEYQTKTDALYDKHLEVMKSFETMSKSEVQNSANPLMASMHLKLTDHERSILSEVSKINGWSRQETESVYKMSIASAETNGIGNFLLTLTQIEPGYYGEDGGTALGLTEADRRRLMNISDNAPTMNARIDADVTVSDGTIDFAQKTKAESSAKWIMTSLSKRLTGDENSAISEFAKLSSVDASAAKVTFKLYAGSNENNSLGSFLQMLSQLAPDFYDKDGLQSSIDPDEGSLIRVKV